MTIDVSTGSYGAHIVNFMTTVRWLFWLQIGALLLVGLGLYVTEVTVLDQLDPTLNDSEIDKMYVQFFRCVLASL